MTMYDTQHKSKTKLLVLFWLAIAFVGGLFVDFLTLAPKLQKPNAVQWGMKNDSNFRQFQIRIPDEILDDLRIRLTRARIANETASGVLFEYGFHPHFLRELVDFWIDSYDWRQREKFLNQYEHYTTVVQGIDIHFVHVKPKNKRSLPLLMVHGWPNSFRDFYSIIPRLTENLSEDFGFELIIPSLPGFVFSEDPKSIKVGSPEYAVVLKTLMQRLGHEKFYAYGMDWGSLIVTDMATLFPKNLLGMYSPLCISFRFSACLKLIIEEFIPKGVLEYKSKYGILDSMKAIWKHSAYLHMHHTKPETIAAALNDSPVGLAAHMLQIVSSGNNVEQNMYKLDGGLSDFRYEDLLDTIMLYWTTNTVNSAVRSYIGLINNIAYTHQVPISKNVPCSCPIYPNEIYYQSNWVRSDKFTNIVQHTKFDEGGHFMLLENKTHVIKMAADDIYKFVKYSQNYLTH